MQAAKMQANGFWSCCMCQLLQWVTRGPEMQRFRRGATGSSPPCHLLPPPHKFGPHKCCCHTSVGISEDKRCHHSGLGKPTVWGTEGAGKEELWSRAHSKARNGLHPTCCGSKLWEAGNTEACRRQVSLRDQQAPSLPARISRLLCPGPLEGLWWE